MQNKDCARYPQCFQDAARHMINLSCNSCNGNKEEPMDEMEKTCIKCNKELPKTEEYFRKNSSTKDGFEGQCKNCRKQYFSDYRAGKRIGRKKKDPAPEPRKYTRRNPDPAPKDPGPARKPASPPPFRASPAEIMIALRKGFASEIVDLIRKEYEL